MLEYLIAHIAIPFAAGVVVLAIEVVSSPTRIDWTVANDGARDMTIRVNPKELPRQQLSKRFRARRRQVKQQRKTFPRLTATLRYA